MPDIEVVMGLVLVFNFVLWKVRCGQGLHHFKCPCGNDLYFNDIGTMTCGRCGAVIEAKEKGKGGQILVTLHEGDKMFKCPCGVLHFVKHGVEKVLSCSCGNRYFVRNCSELVVSSIPRRGSSHSNSGLKIKEMQGRFTLNRGGKMYES